MHIITLNITEEAQRTEIYETLGVHVSAVVDRGQRVDNRLAFNLFNVGFDFLHLGLVEVEDNLCEKTYGDAYHQGV